MSFDEADDPDRFADGGGDGRHVAHQGACEAAAADQGATMSGPRRKAKVLRVCPAWRVPRAAPGRAA